jgi:hypothetical protein
MERMAAMRGPASWLPKWIQFLRLWKDFHNATMNSWELGKAQREELQLGAPAGPLSSIDTLLPAAQHQPRIGLGEQHRDSSANLIGRPDNRVLQRPVRRKH